MKERLIIGSILASLLGIESIRVAQSAPPSSQTKPAKPDSQQAANLLIYVAELQRHLPDDVYRYPYATDVTGQNVFRAGLVRLSNYETLFPGSMRDAVALARAQAYEKLTAYAEAGKGYQIAQQSSDSNLSKVAGEGFERVRKFDKAANPVMDKSGMRTFERDLQTKIRDLDDLASQYKGTPYSTHALLERERAQLQLAEFYLTNRFILPYSTNDAIAQIKRNIEQNRNSKNLYTHHLMLADLYYDLAREYTILNDPDGPDFKLKEFQGFANSARTEYGIVQQADGFSEKLEGRAKLAALEAFVERISDRAR
ncbi:MAG: hypothetical protein K1X53_17315 [Candidatus Sumerlaeaceae bacterium]|nr:hypothetical protein [Candidatus Sumerlaeaceae bacterium]